MTRPDERDPCLNEANHTECPEDLTEWSKWAFEQTRAGYRTIPCIGCGLYVIWTREMQS